MSVFEDHPYLLLGSRMKRMAEQMQADAAVWASEAGVSIQPGQYPLLMALCKLGPTTISELANALGTTQPSVTATTARLVEAGLTEINPSSADRRQRIVSLSAAGHQALEASEKLVWPAMETAVRDVASNLSGNLVEQLAVLESRLAAEPLSVRARRSASVRLSKASETDIPAVVELMNLAYRGRGDEAGWNSEADYMEGPRTNETLFRRELDEEVDASLLLWREHGSGTLIGCVLVRPEPHDVWYLGSLTIDPLRQAKGLGRALLSAAEAWIRTHGGTEVRMTVVNVREALLSWYGRRGYRLTAETEPFPYGDARFGIPKRDDLEFVVLRKSLARPA